jgi:hypothetical protein
MTTDYLATELQTAVRVNDTKLFASLELSKSRWLVTVSAPGSEKLSKHVVIGGDGGALLNLLGRLRAAAERRGGMAVQVVVIQEEGLDGSIASSRPTRSRAMLSTRPRSQLIGDIVGPRRM